MPARERRMDRATRIARHDVVQIGAEIRTARMAAGLSQRFVGRASGMSYSQIGRIERATLPSASVDQLARIGGAVGLDVRVKAYPGIAPIATLRTSTCWRGSGFGCIRASGSARRSRSRSMATNAPGTASSRG